MNKGKIKYEEVDSNTIKICCCDLSIEHNEISKIKIKSKSNNYLDVSPLVLNGKGKLVINSNICYFYEDEKFCSILGRKSLMGRILQNINNNGKYVILFGEKDLRKVVFSESLCVYLYERKVINNYEIFRIYSELDFTDMKNKINDENQKLKLINQKNVKVIKFDNNNFENNIKYFKEIYQNFCKKEKNINYSLFLYSIGKEKMKMISKNLEKKH
jgi:hypothetical protein